MISYPSLSHNSALFNSPKSNTFPSYLSSYKKATLSRFSIGARLDQIRGFRSRGRGHVALRAESDIRDARVDSQKACAERDVLKQEKIFSRRILLFSGTRLISFSKSVHR